MSNFKLIESFLIGKLLRQKKLYILFFGIFLPLGVVRILAISSSGLSSLVFFFKVYLLWMFTFFFHAEEKSVAQ